MHEGTFLRPGLLKHHCWLFCNTLDVLAESGICQNSKHLFTAVFVQVALGT